MWVNRLIATRKNYIKNQISEIYTLYYLALTIDNFASNADCDIK